MTHRSAILATTAIVLAFAPALGVALPHAYAARAVAGHAVGGARNAGTPVAADQRHVVRVVDMAGAAC